MQFQVNRNWVRDRESLEEKNLPNSCQVSYLRTQTTTGKWNEETCSIIWQRYGKRERFSVAISPQKRSQAPAACNLPFVLVKYGTFVSAQLITSESAMIHTAIVHLLRLFAPMRLHSIHTYTLTHSKFMRSHFPF